MNGKAGCPLGDWYYQGEGGWASQPKTPMSDSESDLLGYSKLTGNLSGLLTSFIFTICPFIALIIASTSVGEAYRT